MQRHGKAPMNDESPSSMEDYNRCLSMFGSLQLGNPNGNPSCSTSREASSSNYPASYPSQQPPPTPQRGLRDQLPQPPLPYTSVQNNRGLYPFTAPPPPPPPPPTFSPGNYQASYDLPYQETIFDIITHSEGSNLFIRKVQQLIRSGSIESLIQIILMLSSNPYSLYLTACCKNGSWTLQKLIKTIKSWPIVMSHLTQALSLGFPHIACDVSGRHVIRECFKELSFVENKVLGIKMQEHCLRLAMDRFGCILLNECIPLMERTYKDGILKIIVINCQRLALDRYGTYVVQNAVVRKHRFFTPLIVEHLRGMITNLSIEKEGSHLVEKCLDCSLTKHIVMEELLELNSSELCALACDEFGNFVIQKTLLSSPGEESPEVQQLTVQLQWALYPHLRDLQSHSIGRIVYKKYRESLIRQRFRGGQ